MKFIHKIYRIFLALTLGIFTLSGCQKQEQGLSKAILASANLLEFEAENPSEQLITVYADADWVVEKPEWVYIDPVQGRGTMDVVISVDPNMNGKEQNAPRKGNIIFKGATLASQAVVEIRQKGDKYKGVKDMTVSEAVLAVEETMLSIHDAQVVAKATDGFIVSDGKENIFISSDENVFLGDNIIVRGMRKNISNLPAVANVDNVQVLSNTAITYPQAIDITDQIDKYDATTRTFITVEGEYDGSTIKVEGQKFSVFPLNPDESLKLSQMKGAVINVSGYFAGRSEPVINITVAKVKKMGQSKVVWFQDDFSWLEKYAKLWDEANPDKKVGDAVKNQSSTAQAPSLFKEQVFLNAGFVEDFTSRGYADYAGEKASLYIQTYYLKMGRGGTQNGLKLTKPFPKEYAGEDVIIEFDWCAHGGGSGKIDGVEVVVEIDGAGQIDANGTKISDPVASTQTESQYFWQHVVVKASGLDSSSKIYFRPLYIGETSGSHKYQRWHIDNIMIYTDNQ